MAASTIEAELTVVNIVGTMAIVAAGAESHLDVERLPMAGFAISIAMSAVKRKCRLTVVIEAPPRPVDRRVAECTTVGKAVAVRVFGLVARHAVHRRIPEFLSFMTIGAVRVDVLAKQREAGQSMVKEDALAPRLLVVTVLADNSLGTLVGVVFLMA